MRGLGTETSGACYVIDQRILLDFKRDIQLEICWSSLHIIIVELMQVESSSAVTVAYLSYIEMGGLCRLKTSLACPTSSRSSLVTKKLVKKWRSCNESLKCLSPPKNKNFPLRSLHAKFLLQDMQITQSSS